MTDQPPSQQPSEEPEGDTPAALTPDDAPTAVSPSGSAPEPRRDSRAARGVRASGGVRARRPRHRASDRAPRAADGLRRSAAAPAATAGGRGGTAAARLESVFPPDRPERAVGAAFAGGLVLALILKPLAR